MGWFQKLCRNTGLMIHNIKSPNKPSSKQVVKHEVEEKQVDQNITLRRTTIEEIEMKPGADQDKLKDAYSTDPDKFKDKY